jgi:seryl-tRNA synthetase
MKPADPIEGMLISQLVVANEAALNLYRLAWLNNAEYFEASAKYLHLADKASRTVAMLTERLDQHRNRGQQQIVVKHVTVNADQAVVTDSVVTGKQNDATSSAKLLATATEKPMQIIEPIQEETVPVGDGGAKEE